MEIIENYEGQVLKVTFIGNIDKLSAPEIEKRLRTLSDEVTRLEVDFAQVEYISSAGLRLLAMTQNMMDERNGEYIIKNPNSTVMSVLKMTGFDSILTIE